MYFESEYHRRRAEAEMTLALTATPLPIAIKHLELAKLHHEARDKLSENARSPIALSRAIGRTDKEA